MTRAGQFLLYTAAFLMPWWVYALMPQYVLFPLTYVLLALVCLFIVDAIRHGWRIPFELTLPLAILSAAAVAVYIHSLAAVPLEFREPLDPIYSIAWYLHPLAALAALHFARSRRVVFTALNVLTFSAAAAAAVYMLAWLTGLYPTASSMGIYHWTPPGLPVYALVMAGFAAQLERRSLYRLAFAAAAAVLTLSLLLTLPDIQLPALAVGMLPAGFLLLMAGGYVLEFWPVARIAAKIEMARRETKNRLEPLLMLSLTALAALGLIVYGVPATAEYMLIALAGAWALPEREQAPYAPDWRLAAALVPLCALIAFNLIRVNPENHLDPRNYAPHSPPGMLEAIDNLDREAPALQTVEARYPKETQTNFWLAYAELLRRNAYDAALQYRQSLQPAKQSILPPPTDEQRRAFMGKLRDFASANPPARHRGAYVLALVSEGKNEEALALMRRDARTIVEPPLINDSDRAVFVEAVQLYLHDPRLNEFLADWSAQDLLALLLAWGAEIAPAPAAIPTECLPAVALRLPGAQTQCVTACRIEELDVFPPIADGAQAITVWLRP